MKRELSLSFDSIYPLSAYLRRPIGQIPDWTNSKTEATQPYMRAVWWVNWGGFWLRWYEEVQP